MVKPEVCKYGGVNDECVGVSNEDRISIAVPELFKCSLSKKLIRDPVLITTGETYDLLFFQRWLRCGNRTCPITLMHLSHFTLKPNLLLRDMITSWHKNCGIELWKDNVDEGKEEQDEKALSYVDNVIFRSMVEKMACPLFERKEAAKNLFAMTKQSPSVQELFAESKDAVGHLLSALYQVDVRQHADLRKDIITMISSISTHKSNQMRVAKTHNVIQLLVDGLKSRSMHFRANAAATLFTLPPPPDSDKAMIGECSALKPLVFMLEKWDDLEMKEVARVLNNLFILDVNRERAVTDGAVKAIIKNIKMDRNAIELLVLLALLSTNEKAIEQMVDLDGVPCKLNIIRRTRNRRINEQHMAILHAILHDDPGERETTKEEEDSWIHENCVAILHKILYSDPGERKTMKVDEMESRTLSQVVLEGTYRAKKMPKDILERLMLEGDPSTYDQ